MLDLRKIFKDYTNSAKSFNELIPWMSQIAPHMVINKDGSLMVCYQLYGQDAEGKERYEVDGAVRLIEQAQKIFNERYTVWYTVDRRRTREYVGGDFENEISALVNSYWEESITDGSQFTNKHYLSVLYTPPKGVEGFLEKVRHFTVNEDMALIPAIVEAFKSSIFHRAAFSYESIQLAALINEFMAGISGFEETAAALSLKRLEKEDLLGFLYRRCNPGAPDQNVKTPNIPLYLDSHLTGSLAVDRGDLVAFKSADHTAHVGGLSIKDWPDYTEPGLLDALLAVPGEITYSQVFRFTSHETAKKTLEAAERHNRNMSKSLKTYIAEQFTQQESSKVDLGRIAMAEDAKDALTEMTTDSQIYGYYNLTVLALGDDQQAAETTLKMVSQVIRQRMYVVIRESMHLQCAIAGTMPGQAGALVRWFFVSGSNLADLAPIRTMSTGRKVNHHYSERRKYQVPALTILPTEFNTPYWFNFHQSDLAHTFVVGPSRTGKSAFMNFLLSQFQKYRPCQTYIFDKDYSCRIPTILQGGQHLDLAGDHGAEISLNPLTLLTDQADWPWIAQWVSMLISAKHNMTATDDKSLWEAIENTAVQPREHWRLRTLAGFLPSHLHDQLMRWIGNGPMARYFDNEEDNFSLGSFTCIEMNRLFDDELLARAFMDYAFFRIFKQLNGDPTVIYIEEAWFMLKEQRFARKIDDWLRTLAKKNAFVCMATQSLQELAGNEIFGTLIDNIPNKIFLPNENALAHIDLYRDKFSLNLQQIERIRTGIRKRNYYIVTPALSRMVDVSLPKQILAVVRSDDQAQAVFNRHNKKEDGDWMVSYLEEMCA